MQDIFGSVRRSLVFRATSDNEESPSPIGEEQSTLVEKINSCIRKSRVFSKLSLSPQKYSKPSVEQGNALQIRWRKGELIGCGSFGRVYMGMNLDSGELIAIKQVLLAENSASTEKAQAHIKELEDEVKILKKLSHSNIVRYLGTVREEETINILMEFIPGGSISSLLSKFGSFPETVIRAYTKQLLFGLDHLHRNGIMHRDIKGANILVDNKGCIKLADFGASKQVAELATISGAKSMKGTPYWMAPEVILQTGHSFSADIWSVGCTVIEMTTGKPPWSQQYQEVAALFHIGTTKSHPPIPEQLSNDAKDFLLKCLQKEPNLRPAASELLQHPFIERENTESHPISRFPTMDNPETPFSSYSKCLETFEMSTRPDDDICNLGSMQFSTTFGEKSLGGGCDWKNNNDANMVQIDRDDTATNMGNISSSMVSDKFKSFNPVIEPSDDWDIKLEETLEAENNVCSETYQEGKSDFSFHCATSLSEDDDELTESKIRAFLDEKALDLKKLQTPLYEEFYNSMNAACSPNYMESTCDETSPRYLKLPPKNRSPSRGPIGTSVAEGLSTGSPGSNGRRVSNVHNTADHTSHDTRVPPCGLPVDGQQDPSSPSLSFSERQRRWKEELDQELERKREIMRQAGVGGKTLSPHDRAMNRQRDRTMFASPSR